MVTVKLSFLLSFVSVSNFWKKLAQAKESWYQTSETKVKVGKAGTGPKVLRKTLQLGEMEHSSGERFLLNLAKWNIHQEHLFSSSLAYHHM